MKLFKICYRCPKCTAELEYDLSPHFASPLHIAKLKPCYGVPELTVICSLEELERGAVRRGFVPADDFIQGEEWAVDSTWDNPPPDTLQVIVIPLPKEAYLK